MMNDMHNIDEYKTLFLHSRYASLGETVGNITHQWKQPLNAIVSIQNRIKASLLYEGEIASEKLIKLVDTSYDIVQHLADTIDVFYGFLLQEGGSGKFDILDELDKIKRLTEYSFENSDIKLEFDIRCNPKIEGNSAEFTHALFNIILNAKEAFDSKRSDISPKISIRVDSTDALCKIHISDNAGGITIDPIETIFNLSVSSKDEGSGLGLFIAKNIIEKRFEGTITAQNRHEGAAFDINVPLIKQRQESDAQISTLDEINTLKQIQTLTQKVIEYEELERKLRGWFELFEQATWGIAIVNAEDRTFESYNQSFANIYGYEPEELVGQSASLIFEDRLVNGHDTYESQHQRKNGIKFYAAIELILIKNTYEESLYHVYNVWDISEKHRLTERLNINQFAIDHTNEAILLADKDANFVYVNQAACQSFNYSKEELVGMNIADIDPNFTYEHLHELQHRLNQENNVLIEVTHRRKDGSLFPAEVSGSLFKYKGTQYYMSIERDISERKAMQEALALREIEFHSLADNLPDYIARWDSEGRYLYINKTLANTLPICADDILGKSIKELSPDDKMLETENAIAKVIATHEKVTQTKFEHQTNRGVVELHDIVFVPEFDANGVFKSVLAVGRDMSEYYRMQEHIEAKERELRLLADMAPGMIGIYHMRTDGSFCMPYLSPHSIELFGIHPEEVREDSSIMIKRTHPDDTLHVRESIIESARTMTLWHSEYRIIHPQKGIRWMEGNSTPTPHPEGGIVWYGYVHDITERKLHEYELQKQEKMYRSLTEKIPCNIIRWDKEGRYLYVNPLYAETTVHTPINQLLGKTVSEAFPDGRFENTKTAIHDVISSQKPLYFNKLPITLHDGTTQVHDVQLIPEFDDHGVIESVLGIGFDMSEHYRMQDEITDKEQQLRHIVETLPGVIGSHYFKPDGTISIPYISPNALELFGIEAQALQEDANLLFELVHPDDKEVLQESINEATKSMMLWHHEYRIKHPQKGERWIEGNTKPIPHPDGGTLWFGYLHDITERKLAEHKIEHLAYYDTLTSLPKRTLAQDRAEQILFRAARDDHKAAFLFIDMDNFNAINSSFGHQFGDKVLATLAKRLEKASRKTDVVSRFEGDQFLLVISDIQHMNSVINAVERVGEILETPCTYGEHNFSMSVSIGISLYPDNGDSFDVLFQKSEIAMYKAKEDGKNIYRFFNEEMNQNLISKLTMNQQLKEALHNNEFELHYQPQIEPISNKIVGVEALLRWRHPKLGMIAPDNFIPIAESNGLIVPLGGWVIQEACYQAVKWQKQGIYLTIAVNISAIQFKRGNLKEVVAEALHVSGLEASYLELELTESILMSDVDKTLHMVNDLKALGVRLSIDDFGTGYSSLAYLKRFAVDKLKIDRSFILNILHDDDDKVIVKTIIQMAQNLRLTTIAEGVEDQQTLDLLMANECDEIQGYYFCKPLQSKAFESYFREFK